MTYRLSVCASCGLHFSQSLTIILAYISSLSFHPRFRINLSHSRSFNTHTHDTTHIRLLNLTSLNLHQPLFATHTRADVASIGPRCCEKRSRSQKELLSSPFSRPRRLATRIADTVHVAFFFCSRSLPHSFLNNSMGNVTQPS